MSWIAGLCSVTFRQLRPEQIVSLAASGGLKAIEWGSDVHLPPGDYGRARHIAALCQDEGLSCPTLGSYARATTSERSQPIEPLIETALALGAETIRVWAGETGFAEADETTRLKVADAIHAYAEAAAAQGLKIALEYHPDTLTDCREGACWLLKKTPHPALFSYWQPLPDHPLEACRGDLEALGERLAHLHVFYWKGDKIRHPLAEGCAYWAKALARCPVPKGGHAFLEFVKGDEPERLPSEAAALIALLKQATHQRKVANQQ